jgi:hypothetical protein
MVRRCSGAARWCRCGSSVYDQLLVAGAKLEQGERAELEVPQRGDDLRLFDGVVDSRHARDVVYIRDDETLQLREGGRRGNGRHWKTKKVIVRWMSPFSTACLTA